MKMYIITMKTKEEHLPMRINKFRTNISTEIQFIIAETMSG